MSILTGNFNNMLLGSVVEEKNKITNIGELKISTMNTCEKCGYPWNPASTHYTECKNCGSRTLVCPRCKTAKEILPDKQYKVMRKTFYGKNCYTEVMVNYCSEKMSKSLKEMYEERYNKELEKQKDIPKQKIFIEEIN